MLCRAPMPGLVVGILVVCTMVSLETSSANSDVTETSSSSFAPIAGIASTRNENQKPENDATTFSNQSRRPMTKYRDVYVTLKNESGLRGHIEGRVATFKGIPFAHPPVGARRWRPPSPFPAWTGVRDANEYGSPCLQANLLAVPGTSKGSEDCLTLNVWSPRMASRPGLPVMVFFHGGANVFGSSDDGFSGFHMYDGRNFASQGVVLVSLNYRLGPLGFLALPELAEESGKKTILERRQESLTKDHFIDERFSGNFGLQDQIMALRWIQENIASFGGDPRRITVFGESAGAIDLIALLTSPMAKGLFSRVLLQSGTTVETTLKEAESMGQNVAKAMGCEKTTHLARCLGLGRRATGQSPRSLALWCSRSRLPNVE